MIQIPNYVQAILDCLTESGYAAYVVGGCVRDSLLGKTPSDWDVATSATPLQMQTALQEFRLIPVGLAHGTLCALSDGQPVEVTTFRIDGAYSDHRHPDQVSFTTELAQDLSRRDFTINAMAYHPKTGLVDCFGGQEDLQKRVIRCVGSPQQRFQEDALRILRALRFSSVLSCSIAEETAESIRQQHPLLRQIAVERLQAELLRLLCGENVEAVLLLFAPVFATFMPELSALFHCAQENPYHIYNVWEHTVKAVAFAPKQAEVRMALLLHDIAKPACKTVDLNGIAHFYGHAQRSAAIAEKILKRLRFSRKFQERVTLLIYRHDLRFYENPDRIQKWLGTLGAECFFQLLDVMVADGMAKSTKFTGELELLELLRLDAERILEQGNCLTLADLAVNGQDLLQRGYKPGRQLGNTLQRLLDAVLAQEIPNEKDALLQLADHWR